jgi:hypothetical protein
MSGREWDQRIYNIAQQRGERGLDLPRYKKGISRNITSTDTLTLKRQLCLNNNFACAFLIMYTGCSETNFE